MGEFFRVHKVGEQSNIRLTEIGEMLKRPNVSLVFDFDHTLFNTSNFHRKSFQGALNILGRSLNITPELGAQLRGKSDEEILEILLKNSGGVDGALLARAVKVREDILRQLVRQEQDLSSYFMPEIPDLIRSLRRYRRKVGIASNSPDSFIHAFVEKANVDGKSLDDTFIVGGIIGATTIRVIRNALSVGSNISSLNKPNPFSIAYSASKIDGEQGFPVLYVGDGRIDALSVQGRKNMVGLIINSKDEEELSSEFNDFRNIVVIRSIKEVINEK